MRNNFLKQKKWLKFSVQITYGIFALYTFSSFLIYWDPTRLILARLKASSPFIFEELNPKFITTDPRSIISITNNKILKNKRNQLRKLIWGNQNNFINVLPSRIEKDFHLYPSKPSSRPQSEDKKSFVALYDALNQYRNLENLARIDRITIGHDHNWRAYAGVFYPVHSNNRLAIYQNGFASTYHNQWRLIGDLIREGFTVVAHNFRWYGVNSGEYNLRKLEYPLRGFVDPIVVSLNHMLKQRNYKSIDMIGFSAGGWLTTFVASVELRISRSYTVSGVYPMYLREGNEFPLPNVDKLILPLVSYLDLFLLGATGPGRGQIHIFNQFDKCCFRNTKGKLYEKVVLNVVRSLGPGRFKVLIDKTHARHKISRFTFEKILSDINRND